MKLFSCLICLLSIAYLGAQTEGEGRIINGSPVEPPFKYPWMAAIFRYGEYRCGGVQLSENVVLTAAHCMGGTAAPLENFQVHLHRHDLKKNPQEESGLVFPVVERHVQPEFNPDLFYNDLAVIILNTTSKAPTNSTFTSIQLDTQLKHEPDTKSTVMGWGRITPTGAPHPILQEVGLPIYNDQKCIEDYKVTNYTIKQDIQICAGFVEGGKDSCGADSGGPLFAYIDDKPVLIGIVSNGPEKCGAPNSPGIYVRVAKFRDWILSIINKYQHQ